MGHALLYYNPEGGFEAVYPEGLSEAWSSLYDHFAENFNPFDVQRKTERGVRAD